MYPNTLFTLIWYLIWYIIYVMQFKPDKTYIRKSELTKKTERCFQFVNLAFDKAAIKTATWLSRWRKGKLEKKKRIKRKGSGPKMKRLWTLVLLPTVVANNYPKHVHKVHFGASQFVIGINNRSTTSMSNEPSDFIGKLDPATVRLKSYNDNKTVQMMKGTIKWNL